MFIFWKFPFHSVLELFNECSIKSYFLKLSMIPTIFFFSLPCVIFLQVALFNLLFWMPSPVWEAFLKHLVIILISLYSRMLPAKAWLTTLSVCIHLNWLVVHHSMIGSVLCWKTSDAFLLLGVRFHEDSSHLLSEQKDSVACVWSIEEEDWRSAFICIHLFDPLLA